jgi:ferric-dicitrate binding protein FerR (iron transport regulator)
MSLQEARQFVSSFVTGEYTREEHAAFLQWLKKASAAELAIITDTYESYHGKWVLSDGPSSEWVIGMEQKLDASVREDPTVMDDREAVVAPVMRMRPGRVVRWNSWMTAAAVVAALSAGTFIYVHQKGTGPGKIQDREKLLAMTFVTPQGVAQKELMLEDGSKVWLNAGSVLKYPAHFTGSERLVELSGEAFFDVAGRSGSPFRVLIKDAEVDVLGTYFTIMAYADEPVSRTTLVDGAVKVISGERIEVLKPGEQAEIDYPSPGVGAEIAVHSGIDTKSVLAWKNGIYSFKSRPLRTVMRELERVYDVKVQYQPNVDNPPIGGNLDLNKGLDIVLSQLEGSLHGKPSIHFTHKGKTVIASSV